MTPELFNNFLIQWGTIAFTVYTALVALSSIAVKVIASYIKGMQENVPEYKPSIWLYRALAFLEALALNSPTATAILKGATVLKAKEATTAKETRN